MTNDAYSVTNVTKCASFVLLIAPQALFSSGGAGYLARRGAPYIACRASAYIARKAHIARAQRAALAAPAPLTRLNEYLRLKTEELIINSK